MTPPGGYRGRFAPSPTGPLHLGSLLTAVASYLDARAAGGRWLVRVEDIDPPREVPGASAAILESLRRHGLAWDGDVVFQSARTAAYRAALVGLQERGLVFPCACTRARLGPGGSCGGRCAPRPGEACAQRLRLTPPPAGVEDRLQGPVAAEAAVRDIVLWRKDGLPAYALAVTVDDHWQRITDVVRGADLLSHTVVQAQLMTLLGAPVPRYAHLPVLCGEDGRKLSKQNGAPAIDDSQALANLRRVLGLLRQRSAAAGAATPAELLALATDQWQPAALRGIAQQRMAAAPPAHSPP